MQARHGGVLVGDVGDRARVEVPQPAVAHQRVDEAVVVAGEAVARVAGPVDHGGVEQAWRHERVAGEADEREGGGDGHGVAPLGVVDRVVPEEPHQGDDRHDEVERAVVDVPEADEAVVGEAQVPALQAGLDEQAEGPLEPDHVLGVAVGVGHRQRAHVDAVGAPVRAEGVAHERVEGVEAADVDQLAPPAEPPACRGDLLGRAGMGDQLRPGVGVGGGVEVDLERGVDVELGGGDARVVGPVVGDVDPGALVGHRAAAGRAPRPPRASAPVGWSVNVSASAGCCPSVSASAACAASASRRLPNANAGAPNRLTTSARR